MNEIGEFKEMEKSDISQRKGYIALTWDDLMVNPQPNMLKALFSNFFPCGMENLHTKSMYDILKYWGISPMFRLVEEEEDIPQYLVTMVKKEDGTFEVESFDEVK